MKTLLDGIVFCDACIKRLLVKKTLITYKTMSPANLAKKNMNMRMSMSISTLVAIGAIVSLVITLIILVLVGLKQGVSVSIAMKFDKDENGIPNDGMFSDPPS
jgi:uncharacterized membrane protein YvbJ